MAKLNLKKEFDKIHSKFDGIDKEFEKVHSRMDQLITKEEARNFVTKNQFEELVHIVIKNSSDIEIIKNSMVTKEDHQAVLNRIDHFAKRVDVYGKKADVHDYRLNQIEETLAQHEGRLSSLETPRP